MKVKIKSAAAALATAAGPTSLGGVVAAASTPASPATPSTEAGRGASGPARRKRVL